MNKKKIILYFIRHGETYLNKYKKMQGWSDAPLTPKGEKVALDTGVRLSKIAFDAIYASDLGRTIRTAELILKMNDYKDSLNIIPKAAFRETFFGSFEGSTGSETYGKIAKIVNIPQEQLFNKMTLEELADATKIADEFGDAENYAEFWGRVENGLKEIINDVNLPDDAKILVVAHGNTIRNIVKNIDSLINVFTEIGNSSITTIEYQNKEFKVKGFNE